MIFIRQYVKLTTIFLTHSVRKGTEDSIDSDLCTLGGINYPIML